jgi:hypothetical protein
LSAERFACHWFSQEKNCNNYLKGKINRYRHLSFILDTREGTVGKFKEEFIRRLTYNFHAIEKVPCFVYFDLLIPVCGSIKERQNVFKNPY